MKTKLERTKCTVILKKSRHHKGDYYLNIEAYPVHGAENPRPTQSVGLVITTPIWDKDRPTRGGNFLPKRNKEGIILCRNKIDQDACIFAHKYAEKQQTEFDHKALFPEQYKQKHEAEQKAKMDFIEYIENHIEHRRPLISDSCTRQWEAMFKKLKKFADNKQLLFGDLTPLLINQFREYLITNTNAKGKTLAPNSQKLYLAHFQSALSQAYKEGILATDISIHLDPIKGEEPEREYLTEQELQQVADTPCDDDETRRAALFSALTGFRYVDISKLTWNKISRDETDTPRIQLRQQKTKGVMYQPIPPEARILCGERKDPESLVFPNIATGDNLSDIIRAWVKRAGVENKDITFHCFRHTYATLQLEGGTDLFVVSKLLGHTDVKTTQIYLHMTDKQKQTATTAINLNINQP